MARRRQQTLLLGEGSKKEGLVVVMPAIWLSTKNVRYSKILRPFNDIPLYYSIGWLLLLFS